ncbi:MAG TPA: hypothetical protein VD768_03595 [Sphingomicrobium sp.]|nr:hypothetical protein [Sphingomicrobium sp.]
MIELPTWAVPNAGEPFLIDFGGVLTPGLGAEEQRINRLGNRFGILLGMPPAPAHDRGRILVSRMIRAKTEGLRVELPLLGFRPGSPGSPVVDGNGQSGTSLAVRGFSPNYPVREGQWFTHKRGDHGLLYNVAAAATADAAGEAVLTIAPMLRVEPEDGDVLLFGRPTIEGLVHGDEWRWQMALDRNLRIEVELREQR